MSSAAAASRLKPAFADSVFDGQAVFRRLMSAIAYPGRIFELDRLADAPAPLGLAAASLALALVDFETPVWLDGKAASEEALAWLRFHCGAPVTADAAAARFAFVAAPMSMPRLAAFGAGEDEYPDRSATLVVEVPSLADGPARRWSGPGVDGTITTHVAGLPDWFWSDWELNRELYPQGVDVVFACGSAVVGLPRGIKVEG